MTRRCLALASILALLATACGSRVQPLAEGVDVQLTGGPTTQPTTGSSGRFVPGRFVPGTGGGGNGGDRLVPGDPTCRGGDNVAEGVTKSTIKVGVVAGLTGSLPGAFNASVEATDSYLKQVNAEGGVCGRRFEIIIKDDGQRADNNYTFSRELAEEERVFAFVGGISNTDAGIGQVSRDLKIPDIGFPLDWTRSDSPYTYGVPGQLRKKFIGEGASGSRYLNDLFDIERVAIFWVTDAEVSILSAWAFEAAMKRATNGRIEICHEQATSVFDSGFGNYVANMQSRCAPNPGDEQKLAIYSTMENNNNIKLAEAMELQDFKPRVFAPTFTSYQPNFARPANSPGATEGFYLAMPQIPFERSGGHPEMNRYLEALKRWHPRHYAPGSFGAGGWGMAGLFVTAVAACGAKLTRACVLRELETMGPFSANGFLTAVRPSTHQIYTCDLLVQVRSGRFTEIPRPSGLRGPPESPDFWDCSELFNWQRYFCDHPTQFPDPNGKKKRVDEC